MEGVKERLLDRTQGLVGRLVAMAVNDYAWAGTCLLGFEKRRKISLFEQLVDVEVIYCTSFVISFESLPLWEKVL